MSNGSALFQYSPPILDSFPDVVGGTLHGRQLRNGPSSESLRAIYLEEQRAALQRYQGRSPGEIPSIKAWRKVFQSFGVKPTQYRNAAEALIRRLTKHGDVPSINSLVDLANLISLRYALPVAIFDLKGVQPPITVQIADGSERFTPLGATQVEQAKVGEVVFADKAGLAVARRWCWRQSDESAAREGTVEILATIEGHHESALDEVQAAREDLRSLLDDQIGGDYQEGLVCQKSPAFFYT